MEKESVIKIIQEIVPDAEIKLEGEDCSFTVVVISDAFEGLKTMQRQQKILAGFSDLILNGDIHAISIKAHTKDEWSKANKLTSIELN